MAERANWPLPEGQVINEKRGDRVIYEKNDTAETLVVGTTNLYVDGRLRLIPVRPHPGILRCTTD